MHCSGNLEGRMVVSEAVTVIFPITRGCLDAESTSFFPHVHRLKTICKTEYKCKIVVT